MTDLKPWQGFPMLFTMSRDLVGTMSHDKPVEVGDEFYEKTAATIRNFKVKEIIEKGEPKGNYKTPNVTFYKIQFEEVWK